MLVSFERSGGRCLGRDLGRNEGPSPDSDRPLLTPEIECPGTWPYLLSAPTCLEPAAGSFVFDELGSLSLCVPLQESSSAARVSPTGELLLDAPWLLLVPDCSPAASALVLLESRLLMAPFPPLAVPPLAHIVVTLLSRVLALLPSLASTPGSSSVALAPPA